MTDPTLPLTPVVFHMLISLSAGARHGYAIAQEVESMTDGVVRLGPGTLYGSLQRLVDGGLIREAEAPEDPPDARGERRRYYEITRAGRGALRADMERLAKAVRLARTRMEG
jgi:DNA-binding PadR family transcriptional regulator